MNRRRSLLLGLALCCALLSACSAAASQSAETAASCAEIPSPAAATEARRALSDAETVQNKAGHAALATAATEVTGSPIGLLRMTNQQWQVTMLAGGNLQVLTVNAEGTGLLSNGRQPLDAVTGRLVPHLAVPITDAIATAQERVVGGLVGAAVHSRDESPVWEVTIDNGSCRCSGNPEIVVIVDAVSGKVIH